MVVSNKRKGFLHLIELLNVQNYLSVCSSWVFFPVLNSSHLCFHCPVCKIQMVDKRFLVLLKNFRIILKGMYVASSLQENLEQRLNEGLLVKLLIQTLWLKLTLQPAWSHILHSLPAWTSFAEGPIGKPREQNILQGLIPTLGVGNFNHPA